MIALVDYVDWNECEKPRIKTKRSACREMTDIFGQQAESFWQ